jgi:hypothetical protein
MKKYINTFAFMLLLALSACKVSKDIETPKPALPVAFRDAAQTIPPVLPIYNGKTFLPNLPCKN